MPQPKDKARKSAGPSVEARNEPVLLLLLPPVSSDVIIPKSNLHCFGNRAFSRASPRLWNSMPSSVYGGW
ncbi:hypothetical protein J4Q44_G00356440 [Coregonus suidteri]|uniref:Uncharacterized protein n=1 Tax=Coregonus suidteri TaxID=861788 RepID=A0AAN8Q801_9TELE